MDYKLTRSGENDVEFIAPAGSSFVRSTMPEGNAIALIKTSSKIEKSDMFDGFEICVNDGAYYFAGKFTAEKPADEPKTEEQKKKNKWHK